MLVGGMVDDHVDHDLDVTFMGFIEEPFEIGHCPIVRVYGLIISDIVFVIRGRRHDWHKPDRIGAQLLDVIQFLSHAIEVPYPIPIRIVKGLYKDLVRHPCLWPVVFGLLRLNLATAELQ